MRLHLTRCLLAAAGGLLLPTLATADDHSSEGVVRLGSAQYATSPATTTSGAQQVGFHHSAGACGYGCGTDYGCPSSGCYTGCPSGCGYGCDPHGCGRCGTCGNCGLCGVLHCLRNHPVGGCHYSPDHGWAPPGKHPRPRVAATYRRWFPPTWTGEGAYAEAGYRYPMVYTPTDTTQLGYYHQRVPVWERRAGMIPPVPYPEQFHVPNFGHCGQCGYAGGHYGEIAGGYPIGESHPHGQAVPEGGPVEAPPAQTQPAPEPAPAAEPKPESYVPPAPEAAPEAPPAAGTDGGTGLEKSALAPFLYPTPPL